MGAEPGAVPESSSPVKTVRLDRPLPPVGPGRLVLEDGGSVRLDTALPADLPPGWHRVEPDADQPPWTLVASPGRCPRPGRPLWGWAAQLYAARSTDSWGMGDFGDLARLGGWGRALGAGTTLVNPLHDASPRTEPSPYFPASRGFINPIYIRVEDLPGADQLPDLPRLANAGKALNRERRIDRERVWALKQQALRGLFDRFEGHAQFDHFVRDGGPALDGFATWNALADRHGPGWRQWPASLHRPDSSAVARFAASREGTQARRWQAWLQWHADRQLAEAADRLPLLQDLAVGVSPDGMDAWLYQDTFAPTMHVGAPADQFNTLGQDWGLVPWNPWRLRQAGYEPFVEMVRSALRHAGGVRIDHVMGLFRLYWIPGGQPPAAGTYVRYPHEALLDILALEAHRAGAFVVGEDLGTVEPATRDELADRSVLSYRLAWFEEEPPEQWPARALGAVSTHDLPTVAGVWSGADLAAQRQLGLQPDERAARWLRERLADWAGVGDDAAAGDVVGGVYERLADARCDVLAARLDDVAVVEERPNMPGTIDAWPNWRIALPQPLETLERSPLAGRVAGVLGHRRSGPAPVE